MELVCKPGLRESEFAGFAPTVEGCGVDAELGGDPSEVIATGFEELPSHIELLFAAEGRSGEGRGAMVERVSIGGDGIMGLVGDGLGRFPPSGAEGGSVVEDGDTVDGVAEFADIARPVVGLEFSDQVGFDVVEELPESFTGEVEESHGELRDVIGPGSERGDMEDDLGEAVIEVGSELAERDLGFEVAVGGGKDADFGLDFGVTADAPGFAGFEEPEEFGLELDVHFADFVQEQGAARGLFDEPWAGAHGAGIGALFGAKQFRFHEFLGDGGAVQGHELTTAGGGMESGGDAFLADAGLAEDQDAGHGGAESFDGLPKRFHCGGIAEERFRGGQAGPSVEFEPDLLRFHCLLNRLRPSRVGILKRENVKRAVAAGVDDLSGPQVLTDDEVIAVGLGEADAQVGPGLLFGGFGWNDVNQVGRVVTQVLDCLAGEVLGGQMQGGEAILDGGRLIAAEDEEAHRTGLDPSTDAWRLQCVSQPCWCLFLRWGWF
jgi:hypothetical protein